MSEAPVHDALATRRLPIPEAVRALRHASWLAWLAHPAAYTIGTTVLSVLSMGTTLLAPRLLTPTAFGAFALLTVLYQYCGKSDLGLSQLADRELAARGENGQYHRSEILRARWIIGTFVALAIMPLGMLMAHFAARTGPLDTAFAMLAGAAGMISNGPVTVYRAASQVWEFTAAALFLQLGMTAPRLIGLAVAGTTGCFGALALWYCAAAFMLARPAGMGPRRSSPVLGMLRAALPLFVFSGLWLVYMSANRWISAALSPPEQFGLFAFGANMAFVALGTLAAVAQVRYPRLIAQVANAAPWACSWTIEREALRIGGALAAAALLNIVVAAPLIAWGFPQYRAAAPATIALGVACVPVGIVAWIIPIAIALSKRPLLDAARVFVPSFLVLAGLMVAGNRSAAILGQGWACAVAGLCLFVSLGLVMRRLGIVHGKALVRLMLFQSAVVAIAAILAFAHADAAPARKAAVASAEDGVPPAGWTIAFNDDFDRLSLWDGAGRGTWQPLYPWGGRTNPPNGELEYYVDPRPGHDAPAIAALAPFAIETGALTIRARPIPPADRHLADGLPFASGLLASAPSFSFTYGYVEIRARVPRGAGLWPAFWLIPADRTWPPEIDVMEVLGGDTHHYWATVHSRAGGRLGQVQARVAAPDLAADFHTYAVKWAREEVVWYLDGRRVAAAATPPDMHKAMYLVVNLAVGGWAGAPDAGAFPAAFAVDRIRVFRPAATAASSEKAR